MAMDEDDALSESLWEDFFSRLFPLLNNCECNSLNVNLDFPSAAVLFNQLDMTLSVLRSVSDAVVNMASIDQFQELCACFSEIHLYWWNRMAEIGGRTTSMADMGSCSVTVSGAGKPQFVITNSSHAARFPMDHSTESGGVQIKLWKVVHFHKRIHITPWGNYWAILYHRTYTVFGVPRTTGSSAPCH